MAARGAGGPRCCRTCFWWQPLSQTRKGLVVCKARRDHEYLLVTAPGDGCEDWKRRRSRS